MSMSRDTEARVYIVDDDAGVRAGFTALFKSVSLPVKSFESGEALLEAVDETAMGCLVLDVRMPGMSGLELQDELRRRNLCLAIILISAHGDVAMAVRAMKAGALDFMEKPVNEQDLLDRVKSCLRDASQRKEDAEMAAEARVRLETLTAREREVLDGLVRGDSSKAIASDLGISPRTVDVHRSHVMEKLGVRSIAELVRVVMTVERS